MFANLLNNAARYTPAGGHIQVRGYRDDLDVIVEVIDDGEGIEPKLLPHIFELFTQKTQDIARADGGLGLGLAIVKGIVEAHGGRVSGESEGVGKGSRFTIRLPLSFETSGPSSKLTEPAVAGSQRALRILLVEDNADVAEALVASLRLAGHEVQSAVDGLAALQLLSHFSPEVALIDLGLPVMDGYELARQIAETQRGHEPIMIALTGYSQPADFQKSRDAGFHLHLVKPIKLDVLLNNLSALPLP